MSEFTDSYKALLIYQYFDKPKAVAETELIASEFEAIYNVIDEFKTRFDLDLAVGDQLDKIGKIVGISRTLGGQGLPVTYFGFGDEDGGFNDFSFFGDGDPLFTDELTDDDYRQFIKYKVAKNNASSVTVDNFKGAEGLQTVINRMFDLQAKVIDNQDMTITIELPAGFSTNQIDLLLAFNLIPKPQAVGIKIVISQPTPFSFAGNPNGAGFGVGTFNGIYNN